MTRARIVPITFLLLALPACGGGPRSLNLGFETESPNDCSGNPLTVWVRIYYLTQDSGFRAAGFNDLWSETPSGLAEDLALDASGRAMNRLTAVSPDGMEPLTLELSRYPGTRYVGVVANFCLRKEDGCWKTLQAVNSEENASLLLEVRHTCVRLRDVKR